MEDSAQAEAAIRGILPPPFSYAAILFYLQINTGWNIPIWNFDNLSIAIFIHPYFLLRMICSLINVGAGGAAILGM